MHFPNAVIRFLSKYLSDRPEISPVKISGHPIFMIAAEDEFQPPIEAVPACGRKYSNSNRTENEKAGKISRLYICKK